MLRNQQTKSLAEGLYFGPKHAIVAFQNSKHSFKWEKLRKQQDIRLFHGIGPGLKKREEDWSWGQRVVLRCSDFSQDLSDPLGVHSL